MRTLLWVIGTLPVLAACGASGTAAPPLSIEWTACDLRSEGGGGAAQCAEIDVPARWDEPAGSTLTLFVKRIPAPVQPARTQLWPLNGGPGGPGSDYEVFAESVRTVASDVDVYLLDHRGTGRSSRLGCPGSGEAESSAGGLAILPDEWAACQAEVEATWGDDLAAFRTTEAALDLGALIDATRAPGQEVHVHGGSYGTYLAQRYLQLYPDQATAVSLLGIAPPTESFVPYDGEFDRVGRAYLAACGADARCAAALGPDPAARIEALFDRLDAGHCPEMAALGYTRAGLRQLFAATIFFSWEERVLVPAIAIRLDRCAEADVAALRTLATSAFAPRTPTIHERYQAPVLGVHIGLSELWTTPGPSVAEATAVIDGALFSTEVGARYTPLAGVWPTYAPDALDGAWADTDVPLLMMNGTLDPATTVEGARLVGARFRGPGQRFIELPGANHSWLAPTSTSRSCSFEIFAAFLRDPHAALEAACVDRIVPLTFGPDPTLAAAAFGTDDLW